MIDIEMIHQYLLRNISDKRYVHSKNTAETAEKLAIIYGVDNSKAYISGLIHDCTREIAIDKQHSMLGGIEVDKLTYNMVELLHGYTAEYILRNQFIIYDKDIISAVRYHTTGKENMTLLEKIVFLSDVIEPSRSFPGIENIRELSRENIDKALVAAFDSTIAYLLSSRALIHPNTIIARNYILCMGF